ncbi:MAG TPA: PKD domain-containing protein, partial [Flavobacteriales bacterium]|nr:PKD domain-containing protein [Flavobacteriales bacterium]
MSACKSYLRLGLVGAFALASWGRTHAQNWTMAQGSGSGCGGVMYDSGGEGASGYQNNENYVFTLCPDVPGNVIYLTFFNFNLNTSGPGGVDQLTIYDGNSTAAGTLGTYAGTQLQNVIVSGSVFNTSGCLTLEFHSNGTGTGVFAAGYQCTTPCEHPLAAAVMSEALPAHVCQNEAVVFNGSASAAAPGFNIARYVWDFDDGSMDSTSGPVVNHAYAVAGEYMVQLTIIDNNDCESLNLVDQQVLVSTTPDFSQTSPSVETCFGETVELFGHAEPRTWIDLPEANFGDGIFLPDDVGMPFRSELTFEGFSSGQQITNVDDILSVCVDMEHTFMGDLVLQVICPNGQTTILHQQGGGGTYIGAPNDFDSDVDPEIGECWHYCWSPTATNGTWIENLANTTLAGTPPSNSIDPGTYEPVQSFNNLVGCPLNGTWTFQSSDLWAIDNGFICGWQIDFDPALFPDLTQFTPSIGPDADSSLWAGGTVPNSLSANGDLLSFTATAPGVYDFIYTVHDDFGCTYDTTIQVTIQQPFTVEAGPDAVICNDAIQLNATVEGASTACNWHLHLEDSFGDGWNGSDITVTLNGTSTTYTIGNGSVNNVNIAVNAGDDLILTYSPGNFENEVSYELLD